ncbi:MAG: ABC transporter permease [Planctomycetota bacterium]
MTIATVQNSPRAISTLLNPVAMAGNLWSHRRLVGDLALHELRQRYRATALGWVWIIVTPLVLLAIYTFAFGIVFQVEPSYLVDAPRIGGYALELYCGLIAFQFFVEVIDRAPGLVVGNRNYVTKVVFPLEILVLSSIINALVTLAVGFGVWIIGYAIVIRDVPPIGLLWMPLVLLPLALGTMGTAWILASLGVFVRDIQQTTTLVTRMLFFATPIFYTLANVPESLQWLLRLNPLTLIVTEVRGVLAGGQSPDFVWWGLSMVIGVAIALGGYAFFMKSKRAFADVI